LALRLSGLREGVGWQPEFRFRGEKTIEKSMEPGKEAAVQLSRISLVENKTIKILKNEIWAEQK